MQYVFNVFGFGNDFQQWVQVLNKGCVSSINHGGWLSEPFDISCGIRQGCPFSPLAFVLAVEILAIKIRNSQVAGIKVPSSIPSQYNYLKIKQMADDTSLFLHNKEDMIVANDILREFLSFSGLRLNIHKSKALRLGRYGLEQDLPYVVVNKIKILGIFFQTDKMAKDVEDNWMHRISKVKSLIKDWSRRDLSIQGKVIIIKTFLISQFIYVMQSIGLPTSVLQMLNTIIYKFLWKKKFNNKKAFEKVKRKVIESSIEEGGLGMFNMVHLQKCMYVQWVSKLFSATDDDSWAWIPRWYLQDI